MKSVRRAALRSLALFCLPGALVLSGCSAADNSAGTPTPAPSSTVAPAPTAAPSPSVSSPLIGSPSPIGSAAALPGGFDRGSVYTQCRDRLLLDHPEVTGYGSVGESDFEVDKKGSLYVLIPYGTTPKPPRMVCLFGSDAKHPTIQRTEPFDV